MAKEVVLKALQLTNKPWCWLPFLRANRMLQNFENGGLFIIEPFNGVNYSVCLPEDIWEITAIHHSMPSHLSSRCPGNTSYQVSAPIPL